MTNTSSLPHTRLRLPIVGDLLTVNFAAPAQGVAAQIRKLGAPIMEQRIFNVPVVVIADTALINDVNDEATWEKNVGFSLRKLRPLAGDGLFTAFNEEPNWRRAHNILMPAFTKAAMMSYHDTMTATVREQVDAWREEATWIDIPAAANRLTIEIIARAGFGYSFGNLAAHDGSPFLEAVQRELKYAVRNTDAIPYYEKVFGQRRKALHYSDKALHPVTGLPASSPHAATQAPDEQLSILDRMLHTADPDSGEQLDDDNIINQMLTLADRRQRNHRQHHRIRLASPIGQPCRDGKCPSRNRRLLARPGLPGHQLRRRQQTAVSTPRHRRDAAPDTGGSRLLPPGQDRHCDRRGALPIP